MGGIPTRYLFPLDHCKIGSADSEARIVSGAPATEFVPPKKSLARSGNTRNKGNGSEIQTEDQASGFVELTTACTPSLFYALVVGAVHRASTDDARQGV